MLGPTIAHKTTMCRFFPLGTCHWGEHCRSAHSRSELKLGERDSHKDPLTSQRSGGWSPHNGDRDPPEGSSSPSAHPYTPAIRLRADPRSCEPLESHARKPDHRNSKNPTVPPGVLRGPAEGSCESSFVESGPMSMPIRATHVMEYPALSTISGMRKSQTAKPAMNRPSGNRLPRNLAG